MGKDGRNVRLLVLFVLLLASLPAGTARADSSQGIALAAQAFHRRYCGEVGTAQTTDAARALREVIPVYTRLSSVYDESKAAYLLYWRALLEQCIGQRGRALEDFEAFLRDELSVATWSSLALDARQRRETLLQRGSNSDLSDIHVPPWDRSDGATELARRTALQAHTVLEEHCAEVAAGEAADAGRALSGVVPAFEEVSSALDRTGAPYLLYWRAVLEQCIGLRSRAGDDLSVFLEQEATAELYPALEDDARRRLRQLGRIVLLTSSGSEEGGPRAVIAWGGGYLLVVGEDSPFHYLDLALDLSLRVKGPVRLLMRIQPAVSAPNRFDDGSLPGGDELADGEPRRSLLLTGGVGVGLRGPGDVAPFVGGLFQLAPNTTGSVGAPLLVGVAALGGLELPLGASPVGLRLHGSVGSLGRLFVARGGLSLAVKL